MMMMYTIILSFQIWFPFLDFLPQVLPAFFYVDVVMCLKGSDDNDIHNHLVISDLVSILRFEKSG